jgi:hypothetical protein
VYAQKRMGTRILIAVLAVTLAGANSGLASMCAAYCMSSSTVGSAAAPFPQNDSQQNPASVGHHIHAHHQGAECAECPPASGDSLKQKSDCSTLVQIQTLKEGAFNLDAPRAVAPFHAADTQGQSVGLAQHGERSSSFDTSRSFKSFPPASLPLRI